MHLKVPRTDRESNVGEKISRWISVIPQRKINFSSLNLKIAKFLHILEQNNYSFQTKEVQSAKTY